MLRAYSSYALLSVDTWISSTLFVFFSVFISILNSVFGANSPSFLFFYRFFCQ